MVNNEGNIKGKFSLMRAQKKKNNSYNTEQVFPENDSACQN